MIVALIFLIASAIYLTVWVANTHARVNLLEKKVNELFSPMQATVCSMTYEEYMSESYTSSLPEVVIKD